MNELLEWRNTLKGNSLQIVLLFGFFQLGLQLNKRLSRFSSSRSTSPQSNLPGFMRSLFESLVANLTIGHDSGGWLLYIVDCRGEDAFFIKEPFPFAIASHDML